MQPACVCSANMQHFLFEMPMKTQHDTTLRHCIEASLVCFLYLSGIVDLGPALSIETPNFKYQTPTKGGRRICAMLALATSILLQHCTELSARQYTHHCEASRQTAYNKPQTDLNAHLTTHRAICSLNSICHQNLTQQTREA